MKTVHDEIGIAESVIRLSKSSLVCSGSGHVFIIYQYHLIVPYNRLPVCCGFTAYTDGSISYNMNSLRFVQRVVFAGLYDDLIAQI